ncbi:MAG TPA: glycine zipper 2TM domain-containing protein [Casimicrobiaceae bacterium]|jgi:outer membrane lipoprotein SlyB
MQLRSIAIAAAALALASCASYDYYGRPVAVYEAPAPVAAAPVQRVEYGVVEDMELYREGSGAPVGLSAIIGGIAGGIIGHQFGAGSGNTAATIGGAVAGGLVGNEIQRSNARDRYRITVRLDSGGTLTTSDVGEGELRVGDRVRVVDGRIYRM